MKRFVKLISLGMLLTMASCSTSGGESPSSTTSDDSVVSSSPQAQQDSNGTTLKKVADDMFDYGGAVRSNSTQSLIKRALTPVDEQHRGPEVKLPAVLVYLTGVLCEINGVDPINKAYEFSGDYQFDFSMPDQEPNWHDQTISLTVNAKLDRQNNKILFSGLQSVVVESVEMAHSYIFIDISYNFTTEVLGDFKMYQDQSPTEIYYFESINGQASRSGSEITPEEVAVIENQFNAYRAAFDTLCESKDTATGPLVRSSQEAFVETQKYANGLFGQKIDSVRIKE